MEAHTSVMSCVCEPIRSDRDRASAVFSGILLELWAMWSVGMLNCQFSNFFCFCEIQQGPKYLFILKLLFWFDDPGIWHAESCSERGSFNHLVGTKVLLGIKSSKTLHCVF